MYRVLITDDLSKASVQFDSAGNRVSLTDNAGNTTTWLCDALGRVTDRYSLVATQTGSTAVAHENWRYQGLTTTYTDADGRKTVTTVDPVNRTSTEVWYDPGGATPTNTIVTTTDVLGEVTSVNSYGPGGTSNAPYSSVTFQPDPLGQQTAGTQQFSVNGVPAPTASSATTNQIAAGQGMTSTLIVSLGTQQFSTTTTTADVQGRVAQIRQDINQNNGLLWKQSAPGLDKSVAIAYWATGQRQTLTRSQGSNTPAGYTNYNTTFAPSTSNQTNLVQNWRQDNRPISLFQTTTNANGQTDTAFNQSYSSAATAPLISSVNWNYFYDQKGQLQTVSQWNGSSWVTIPGNSYDSAGNPTNWAIGAGNRVLSLNDYVNTRYQYDLEGHMTVASYQVLNSNAELVAQSTNYSWDNRGELTGVRTVSAAGNTTFQAAYVYDGLGRLIGETDTTYADTTANGVLTTITYGYVYQGSRQLLVLNLTSGSPDQGRVIQSNFLGTQPGEVLAMDIPGQTTGQPTPIVWLYTDLSGSVTSLGIMSSTGAWQIQHQQFGRTGVPQTPLGDQTPAFAQVPDIWQGNELELTQTTRPLYEINGRWYDPNQNRFIEAGPVSATSPNPYTLNGNNPINSSGSVDWSTISGPGAFTTWGSAVFGLGDTLTFGLAFSDDTRSQTNGGYFAGAALGLAATIWFGGAGFGAFRGAYAGFTAAKTVTTAYRLGAAVQGAGGFGRLAAVGYTLAGDVAGVYQSGVAVANGNFSPLNLLGFMPAIGWAGALARSKSASQINTALGDASSSRFAAKPGGTGAAYDAANSQGVYILKDSSGKIRYVGRGDAPQRLLEHAKPGSGKEDLVGEILFNNNLPPAQAQSLEHELMQVFGGPKSINLGTQLRNKIQGIGESNPNFLQLEFAADDELVIEALRRAGQLRR